MPKIMQANIVKNKVGTNAVGQPDDHAGKQKPQPRQVMMPTMIPTTPLRWRPPMPNGRLSQDYR
jgi:hypothetical protein